MRDDFVSVVQVEEQSGARFDQAASSWQHAPVAVGPRVGQVGHLGEELGQRVPRRCHGGPQLFQLDTY